jgi:hypothetical protein
MIDILFTMFVGFTGINIIYFSLRIPYVLWIARYKYEGEVMYCITLLSIHGIIGYILIGYI